jgi:P27 family predicted phage terminase small subunit
LCIRRIVTLSKRTNYKKQKHSKGFRSNPEALFSCEKMEVLGKMATRGRKPTPSAIKALEGNPGKRALNEREPRPEKKAPSCPKWLEPEAKKEWRRLAKKMEALGVLTEVDMAAFAGYCQAYARWKQAEERITDRGLVIRTPSGYPQQVPYISIAQQYLRLMNQFAEQFGLTPAARSRIIAGNGEGGGSRDEMEELLGGN